MGKKFVKRIHYLEGLKRENWGSLRVKVSDRSGATARILNIHDQPLTGYLPTDEALFILDAINLHLESLKSLDGFDEETIRQMESGAL